MKFDLDKDDLVSLVKGTEPNYSEMEHHLIKKHGYFNASYGKWNWNYDIKEKCSEEELFEMYQICKNIWK